MRMSLSHAMLDGDTDDLSNEIENVLWNAIDQRDPGDESDKGDA